MSENKSSESEKAESVELPPVRFHWKPLVIITIVLGLTFTAVAWYGYREFTDMEMKAAGIAAFLCWLGSVLGLIPPMYLRGAENAVSGLLAGMLFRMFIPMAGAFLLQQGNEQWRNAHIMYFTLGFFLLALIVDTILGVQLIKSQHRTQNTKTDI